MKIFSNFDTNTRHIKTAEHKKKYGAENVICFWRSVLYRVIKVMIPVFFLVSVSTIIIIFLYNMFWIDYLIYSIIAVLLVDIVIAIPIIGKYIDYKMDFIIVTPDILIMYDQNGILDKDIITINEKSIKTISVKRNGFLYSVFDNGDVIVLSEWDTLNGEMTLRWVARPEKRRKDILRIMEKDVRKEMINKEMINKDTDEL